MLVEANLTSPVMKVSEVPGLSRFITDLLLQAPTHSAGIV